VGDSARLSALALPGAPATGPDAGLALGRVWDLTHRQFEVKAWFLRLERDVVQVTEEYRLRGETPDRPFDTLGTRSLRLVRGKSGEFQFEGGVL
jgi:hypothetical protein